MQVLQSAPHNWNAVPSPLLQILQHIYKALRSLGL
jgi:hypothetical protein